MCAKNANTFSETTSILTGTCKMYMKYPNMLQATVLWRICALTNFNFVNMGSFENIKETAPFRGVCLFLVHFFKKCYWWAFKQSENKPNSTRRLFCSSSISVHFTFSRLRINSSYRFNSDLKLKFLSVCSGRLCREVKWLTKCWNATFPLKNMWRVKLFHLDYFSRQVLTTILKSFINSNFWMMGHAWT